MAHSVDALRGLFVFFVLFGVGGGLVACGGDDPSGGVDVVNPRLVQTENGNRSFTGTLVNQRSQPLSIAQVEVVLYDDRGSEVETVKIEVEEVPARDSVDFRKTIDSDRAFSQAQVKGVYTP